MSASLKETTALQSVSATTRDAPSNQRRRVVAQAAERLTRLLLDAPAAVNLTGSYPGTYRPSSSGKFDISTDSAAVGASVTKLVAPLANGQRTTRRSDSLTRSMPRYASTTATATTRARSVTSVAVSPRSTFRCAACTVQSDAGSKTTCAECESRNRWPANRSSENKSGGRESMLMQKRSVVSDADDKALANVAVSARSIRQLHSKSMIHNRDVGDDGFDAIRSALSSPSSGSEDGSNTSRSPQLQGAVTAARLFHVRQRLAAVKARALRGAQTVVGQSATPTTGESLNPTPISAATISGLRPLKHSKLDVASSSDVVNPVDSALDALSHATVMSPASHTPLGLHLSTLTRPQLLPDRGTDGDRTFGGGDKRIFGMRHPSGDSTLSLSAVMEHRLELALQTPSELRLAPSPVAAVENDSTVRERAAAAALLALAQSLSEWDVQLDLTAAASSDEREASNRDAALGIHPDTLNISQGAFSASLDDPTTAAQRPLHQGVAAATATSWLPPACDAALGALPSRLRAAGVAIISAHCTGVLSAVARASVTAEQAARTAEVEIHNERSAHASALLATAAQARGEGIAEGISAAAAAARAERDLAIAAAEARARDDIAAATAAADKELSIAIDRASVAEAAAAAASTRALAAEAAAGTARQETLDALLAKDHAERLLAETEISTAAKVEGMRTQYDAECQRLSAECAASVVAALQAKEDAEAAAAAARECARAAAEDAAATVLSVQASQKLMEVEAAAARAQVSVALTLRDEAVGNASRLQERLDAAEHTLATTTASLKAEVAAAALAASTQARATAVADARAEHAEESQSIAAAQAAAAQSTSEMLAKALAETEAYATQLRSALQAVETEAQAGKTAVAALTVELEAERSRHADAALDLRVELAAAKDRCQQVEAEHADVTAQLHRALAAREEAESLRAVANEEVGHMRRRLEATEAAARAAAVAHTEQLAACVTAMADRHAAVLLQNRVAGSANTTPALTLLSAPASPTSTFHNGVEFQVGSQHRDGILVLTQQPGSLPVPAIPSAVAAATAGLTSGASGSSRVNPSFAPAVAVGAASSDIADVAAGSGHVDETSLDVWGGRAPSRRASYMHSPHAAYSGSSAAHRELQMTGDTEVRIHMSTPARFPDAATSHADYSELKTTALSRGANHASATLTRNAHTAAGDSFATPSRTRAGKDGHFELPTRGGGGGGAATLEPPQQGSDRKSLPRNTSRSFASGVPSPVPEGSPRRSAADATAAMSVQRSVVVATAAATRAAARAQLGFGPRLF